MRRFAFNYYIGIFILVFLLYASFLRAVAPSFRYFMIGAISGAGAIVLILIAIYVAWRGDEYAKK